MDDGTRPGNRARVPPYRPCPACTPTAAKAETRSFDEYGLPMTASRGSPKCAFSSVAAAAAPHHDGQAGIERAQFAPQHVAVPVGQAHVEDSRAHARKGFRRR
jgi:hypothetical protein